MIGAIRKIWSKSKSKEAIREIKKTERRSIASADKQGLFLGCQWIRLGEARGLEPAHICASMSIIGSRKRLCVFASSHISVVGPC